MSITGLPRPFQSSTELREFVVEKVADDALIDVAYPQTAADRRAWVTAALALADVVAEREAYGKGRSGATAMCDALGDEAFIRWEARRDAAAAVVLEIEGRILVAHAAAERALWAQDEVD